MENTGRTIRLGTRKSSLAMAQTMLAAEAMKAAEPGLSVEIVPIVTTGDKILDKSLVEFGGKGAFVTEFENAILEGRIDAAVHSAKDMPAELAGGLTVSAVLPREDVRDVFVTVRGREVKNSPMVVGTGSLRRKVQFEESRDVSCKLLRGNVGTRLQKLSCGEYDGIILAAAGLKRLGLFEDSRFDFEVLSEDTFIPAGGQGIIAVEGREDSGFSDLFEKISDAQAALSLKTEREVLRLLGAGCHGAVGVYSRLSDGILWIDLMDHTENGIVRRRISGRPEMYRELAARLVEGLIHG